MLSIATLFGKKYSVLIENISIGELEQEPLPNRNLHSVKMTFQLDGFKHYLAFCPYYLRDQPHPNISGHYLVLQQHGKSRSWTEIEAMERKLVVEIIKTNHRIHPIYTDRKVHAAAAKELEDLLGSTPVFYEIMDKTTNSLHDACCETEIWSCIDLKQAIYRNQTELTQREIARYVAKLSTSDILQEVSLESAYYKKVPPRHLDTLNPALKAKATFWDRR